MRRDYKGYGAPPTVQQKHTCEKMNATVVTQLGPLTIKPPMCQVGNRFYNSDTGLEVTTTHGLLTQCVNVGGTLQHNTAAGAGTGIQGTFLCNLQGVTYHTNGMYGWYDIRSGKAVLVDLYKLTGKTPPSTSSVSSILPYVIVASVLGVLYLSYTEVI